MAKLGSQKLVHKQVIPSIFVAVSKELERYRREEMLVANSNMIYYMDVATHGSDSKQCY